MNDNNLQTFSNSDFGDVRELDVDVVYMNAASIDAEKIPQAEYKMLAEMFLKFILREGSSRGRK